MTTIVPATAAQARELTDRIKVAVDGTWELIKQAYLMRAWDALGYTSWDDYCTREFGTSRLRLPREERQEVVISMREIGMSQRAIAAATGNSTRTVNSDLRQVSQSTTPEPHGLSAGTHERQVLQSTTPEPAQPRDLGEDADNGRVMGIDGKSYAAQPAQPPKRSALPPKFRKIAAELSRIVARLERLKSDDRYRANRIAIADDILPEIRRAVDVLSDFLDDLPSDNRGQQ